MFDVLQRQPVSAPILPLYEKAPPLSGLSATLGTILGSDEAIINWHCSGILTMIQDGIQEDMSVALIIDLGEKILSDDIGRERLSMTV